MATGAAQTGLSSAQTNVARKIIAQGQRMNAPRHVIRVALAAALTESNLLNLHHGDADSVGPFQERASQGWGSPQQLSRVRYQAKQFYKRAIPLFNQGTRGGALAQGVERSAFPGRYAGNLGTAGNILSSFPGGSASAIAPPKTFSKQGPPSVAALTANTTRTVQPLTMLPNPLAPANPIAGPVFPSTRPGELQRRKAAKTQQLGPLNTQGQVAKAITTTTTTPAPIVTKTVQGGGGGMVQQALQAAKSIKGTPYVFGGGHGGFSKHPPNLDCSGAVSYVLHKLGVIKAPLTSGAMGSVLKPGPGAITVFYNAGHTFMRFQTAHGPVYWGTSVGDSGSGGLGKHPAPTGAYLSQYKVGHVEGANAGTVGQIIGKTVQPGGKPTTQRTVQITNGVYTNTPIFSNRPIASDLTNAASPQASTATGLEGKVRRLLR